MEVNIIQTAVHTHAGNIRIMLLNEALTKIAVVIFPVAASAVTLYQIFTVNEWIDKADDVIIMGLMTVAIVLFWVRWKNIPYYFPLLYLVLAFITKISAFFIEHNKPKEIAVDIVALCLILFGVIVNSVVQFVYMKSGMFII